MSTSSPTTSAPTNYITTFTSNPAESLPKPTSASATLTTLPQKPIRVAVLTPSYSDSDSITKNWDDLDVGPAWFFTPLWPPQLPPEKASLLTEVLTADGADGPFTFELISLNKKSVFKTLRGIVKSERFDVFFNLCDGAKDEDRAGEEVVRALEELNVPFTGAPSWCYEPSKPEMKLLANFAGIRTARSAVVDNALEIEARCGGLKFPVIVKHVSGYASIGMTPQSKCADMPALVAFASNFIQEHQSALVEEFVTGTEATVLACADPTAPDGIRVYPPVAIDFVGGAGEFKHFDLKWVNEADMKWYPVPTSSPSYDKIVQVGRTAFKAILGGIGYGRSDVRIDQETGEVIFLEINPNCGVLYQYGYEGSADWVLRYAGANGQGHRDFITLQIQSAIQRHEWMKPACSLSYDLTADAYVVRAERAVATGSIAWNAAVGPQIYFAGEVMSAGPVGRTTNIDWRPLLHSETPNVVLRTQANGYRCLLAVKDVAKGDALTLDFMCPAGEPLPTTKHTADYIIEEGTLPSPNVEVIGCGLADAATTVTSTTAYDPAASGRLDLVCA